MVKVLFDPFTQILCSTPERKKNQYTRLIDNFKTVWCVIG